MSGKTHSELMLKLSGPTNSRSRIIVYTHGIVNGFGATLLRDCFRRSGIGYATRDHPSSQTWRKLTYTMCSDCETCWTQSMATHISKFTVKPPDGIIRTVRASCRVQVDWQQSAGGKEALSSSDRRSLQTSHCRWRKMRRSRCTLGVASSYLLDHRDPLGFRSGDVKSRYLRPDAKSRVK